MAAFSHNGEIGSALDHEIRGLGCERGRRLRRDNSAKSEHAELVKWLRAQYDRQGMIGHSTAADVLDSIPAQLANAEKRGMAIAADIASNCHITSTKDEVAVAIVAAIDARGP